jgi:hypothetical protein
MKFLIFGVLMSFTVGCSASGNDADTTNTDSFATAGVGRLSLQGDKILAPNGLEIQLRGWNWGQWNTVLAGDLASQGYPHADPGDPSDGLDAAHQGANVVRILLRWWGKYGDKVDRFGSLVDSRDESATGHVNAQALQLLDFEISEATRHGLWVVLAVDSNCGQESPTDVDPYCNDTDRGIDHANFVNDPDMKAEFAEIWAHLADTYKSHGHIAMYEVLPEPQFGCTGAKGCNYDDVKSFYSDLIATIRSKDASTPILIGPGSGYSMKNIEKALLPDPTGMNPNKLIYTANMLSREAISRADLGTFTSFRDDHNVPVFVQQVGIDQSIVPDMTGQLDSTAYLRDVKAVLQQLDVDGIGWTWWTYRDQSSNGEGYAPWYLSAAPDTWAPAVAPDMLGTISAYFTN